MSTEQTSEKTNTEVFYEGSEAEKQPPVTEEKVNEGDKETKPEETKVEGDKTAEAKPEGDKEQSEQEKTKTESEADSEGKKDEAQKLELKEVKDLTLPKDSKLTEAEVQATFDQAKELGLNKTQAQAFLEAKSINEEAIQERALAEVEGHKAAWLAEFKADPELGGDNAVETSEHAKRAIDKFGSERFKKLLDDTGAGNHIEFLRVFSNIGKQLLASDSFISGKPSTTEVKSTADLMYGSKS